MKDVDAVEPLIHLLLNPGEETILRAAAADALGTIGNPEAEAALKAIILRDDFAPIHDTARQALERIEKADQSTGHPSIRGDNETPGQLHR
jgi:HEAT repeat protein